MKEKYCTKCGTELRDSTKFCPNCGESVNNNNSSNLEKSQLANYSTVNYVDLYETRAVRSKGRSTQQWTKLARGNFTLGGSQCNFIGGGQHRTFDTKKIVNIIYFSNDPGVEVSVTNRQKSMRFLLPGRTIEDGQRFANAIKNGKTSVALTELTKDPGNCYIATYVYGDYDASEVLTLRKFRDEMLLSNFLGKIFVKVYYNISPILIKHFGGKIFRNTAKKVLDNFVKILD